MADQHDEHAEHQDYERKLPPMTQDDLESFTDQLGRVHYHTKEGRRVCGRLKKAKNRAIENEACLAPPMASGPCRVHGGNAGAPIKHGRYSNALRALRDAFEASRKDEELLDCQRDLAMMDTIIEKLVERLEDFDSPAWREELADTYRQLQAAIRGKRQAEVGPLMKALGDLIDRGATADQLARDLVAQVDKRAARACKLVEIEIKREQKVTDKQLVAVFQQFLQVLERRLEPEVYFAILPELRSLTGASAPAPALAAPSNGGAGGAQEAP